MSIALSFASARISSALPGARSTSSWRANPRRRAANRTHNMPPGRPKTPVADVGGRAARPRAKQKSRRGRGPSGRRPRRLTFRRTAQQNWATRKPSQLPNTAVRTLFAAVHVTLRPFRAARMDTSRHREYPRVAYFASNFRDDLPGSWDRLFVTSALIDLNTVPESECLILRRVLGATRSSLTGFTSGTPISV